MNIELHSFCAKRSKLELRITDPCIPFINGLRRILMGEVPTFAIHDIVEYENTGAIRSERLVHTLGLIPIVVPGVDLLEAERRYRKGNKSVKKSIALRFRLFDVCKGQQDFSRRSTFRRTTSSKLVWMPRTTEQSFLPKHLKPRATYDSFPITNLKAGQKVCIDAICIPGTGLLNAKWSPVCPCFFRYEKPAPRVLSKIAAQMQNTDQQFKRTAPKSACEYIEKCANGQNVESLIVEKSDPVEKQEDESEEEDDFVEDLGAIIFTIETNKTMTPEEALGYGLRIFEEKIDDLLSSFKAAAGLI